MKKIITVVALTMVSFLNAQAYKGKGDVKVQIGANIQDGGSGIVGSVDFGAGENMSYGFASSYLLGSTEGSASDINFEDRIDVKARFNANLGSVIGLNKKMDVYPGLDISLKNFGGHVGARYFFSEGFGIFTEAGFPLARYNKNDYDYNNQFVFNIGASFNL